MVSLGFSPLIVTSALLIIFGRNCGNILLLDLNSPVLTIHKPMPGPRYLIALFGICPAEDKPKQWPSRRPNPRHNLFYLHNHQLTWGVYSLLLVLILIFEPSSQTRKTLTVHPPQPRCWAAQLYDSYDEGRPPSRGGNGKYDQFYHREFCPNDYKIKMDIPHFDSFMHIEGFLDRLQTVEKFLEYCVLDDK